MAWQYSKRSLVAHCSNRTPAASLICLAGFHLAIAVVSVGVEIPSSSDREPHLEAEIGHKALAMRQRLETEHNWWFLEVLRRRKEHTIVPIQNCIIIV